ncbi:MAG: hypothetical protein WCX28_10580 [Bacteriovoracaceae bacterium]|nr:hypothetical protein [Bacteroidota bacterium]
MTISRFFLFILMVVYAHAKEPTFVQRANSVAVFGGMGIQIVTAPDVVQYINSIALYSQRINDFGTSIDFFGGCEFPISDSWGIKLEHAYIFKSYSVPGKSGGTIDFFYAKHSPTMIIQHVITGYGYFVKLGAGGSYHLGNAEQKVSTFGVVTTYSTDGIGLKAEAVGQTAFDEHLFGYIGGTFGWDFTGDLTEKNGRKLVLPNSTTPVSLSSLSAGLRFGIIYYL